MDTKFVGVKNATDATQVLMYDSQVSKFKAGEVKILPKSLADHAATRNHVFQEKFPGGKMGPVMARHLFDIIPLSDALKVATIEEDPTLIEARRIGEEKEKERQALISAIKEQLASEGWEAPKKSKEAHK